MQNGRSTDELGESVALTLVRRPVEQIFAELEMKAMEDRMR